MDLEAIWHSHKPFILKVAGGALVFLILTGISSSVSSDAATQSKRNATQQAAMLDELTQLEGTEGLEKGRAEALGSKIEPVLMKTILWKLEAEMKLPEGEKEYSRYYERRWRKILGSRGDVERHAEKWDAKMPEESILPMSVQDDAASVDEALAKLDLVKRVVIKLLDANVRVISRVELDDAKHYKRKGDGRLLRELPITVVFLADMKTLSEALRTFQVEGSFLQVVSWSVRRLEKSEQKAGQSVEVSIGFKALGVVDRAPEGAVAETSGGSGTSGGGSPSFKRER